MKGNIFGLIVLLILSFSLGISQYYLMDDTEYHQNIAYEQKQFYSSFGNVGKVVDHYAYRDNSKFHCPVTDVILENDDGKRIAVRVTDKYPLIGEYWTVYMDENGQLILHYRSEATEYLENK